jgi:hypothetical protein
MCEPSAGARDRVCAVNGRGRLAVGGLTAPTREREGGRPRVGPEGRVAGCGWQTGQACQRHGSERRRCCPMADGQESSAGRVSGAVRHGGARSGRDGARASDRARDASAIRTARPGAKRRGGVQAAPGEGRRGTAVRGRLNGATRARAARAGRDPATQHRRIWRSRRSRRSHVSRTDTGTDTCTHHSGLRPAGRSSGLERVLSAARDVDKTVGVLCRRSDWQSLLVSGEHW